MSRTVREHLPSVISFGRWEHCFLCLRFFGLKALYRLMMFQCYASGLKALSLAYAVEWWALWSVTNL